MKIIICTYLVLETLGTQGLTIPSLISRLWHGQEFRGFENIPSSGGALIIWFHGPMPADYFGLIAEVWYRQRRVLKTVMDR